MRTNRYSRVPCVLTISLTLSGAALVQRAEGAPVCEVTRPSTRLYPDKDPYESYSVSKLNKLAKKGDEQAMAALGVRYGTGDGVKIDPVASFNFYKSAAELGHSGAQANLSYMYLQGEGTEKNPALAFSWAKKSAEVGDYRGMEFVGYMLGSGEGVERNLKEAAYCYLLAARRGSVSAQHTLANLYSQGYGIPADRQQSALWRERARKAVADKKPWIDPTPDPGMPAEWDSPYVFVAEIPNGSSVESKDYSFIASVAGSYANSKWEKLADKIDSRATFLRIGLTSYDTFAIAVRPFGKLAENETITQAAQRSQPTVTFGAANRPDCVASSMEAPVKVSDSMLGMVAFCVNPRDREIHRISLSWSSLRIQTRTVDPGDESITNMKTTMTVLLSSFKFK